MRRGQQMGINVVIIAAIALLVLVIIALITADGGRKLNQGANSCNANGGRCVDNINDLPGQGDGWVVDDDHNCGDTTEQCYVYQFT